MPRVTKMFFCVLEVSPCQPVSGNMLSEKTIIFELDMPKIETTTLGKKCSKKIKDCFSKKPQPIQLYLKASKMGVNGFNSKINLYFSGAALNG